MHKTNRIIALVLLFVAAFPRVEGAARIQTQAGTGEPGAVRFSFKPAVAARSVSLAGTFNGWNRTATPMADVDGDGVWTVTIELGRGKHLYKFVADGVWHADPLNARKEPDGQGGDNSVLVLGGAGAEELAGTVALGPYTGPDVETPEWAKEVVWYQIFPERFRNGDRRNDPPGVVPWRHAWFERASGESGEFYRFIFDRRYGGDLQGVLQQLDYLQSLGVTGIYFNPIFEAPSLHKYDTADYRHVDDNFGFKGDIARLRGETADPKTWKWTATDRLFLKLIRECHARGIRVIVDGVFNHTGDAHWAFRDVARRGAASPFAGWYKVKNFGPPFEYEGWFGEKSLPEVAQTPNNLNDGYKAHIFAVTRRWMDPNGDGDPADGIDGWRLDVANLVPLGFWTEWRALVKGINPQAYIVAEIWDPAPRFLDGTSFDAQMNYPLLRAVVKFFIDTSPRSTPARFATEIEHLRQIYAPGVVYVQQNLLGSHDTDRIASMTINPNRRFDAANRLQDADGKGYDYRKPDPAAYARLKLVTLFQMTYVGAPMIYYGDEVGMWGADDPSDRKPMPWPDLPSNDDPAERWDAELLDHFRKIVSLRNSLPALQTGSFRVVKADDATGVLVYERRLKDERVFVVINNSQSWRPVEIDTLDMDGAVYHDALNDPDFRRVQSPWSAGGTRATLVFGRPRAYSSTVASGKLHVNVSGGWGAVLVRRASTR